MSVAIAAGRQSLARNCARLQANTQRSIFKLTLQTFEVGCARDLRRRINSGEVRENVQLIEIHRIGRSNETLDNLFNALPMREC